MRAKLAWIRDRLPPSLYFLLAGNSAPSLNGDHDMTETDTEKTPEQLQARITELKALYQQLQDSYD